MHAVGALASLLALLTTNGPSQLDCICSRIHNQTGGGKALWKATLSEGERSLWLSYCDSDPGYHLVERCETLEPPSVAVAAVARLVPWDWSYGPPEPEVGLAIGQPPVEEGDCGAALAAIRGLTREEAKIGACFIADALTQWSFTEGLNDTRWSAETLATDHLRQQKLSQLLHAVRRSTRVISIMQKCIFVAESAAEYTSYLEQYFRHSAPLLPLIATHLSQLFIPLAYEHTGNLTNDQSLPGWIKNMERVRDMLDTKLRGLVHDVQFISEQIANYKVEEDKNRPGKYIIRRPLLSHALLVYQQCIFSFRDDFGALCEQQQPHASQVFGLADAFCSFYRHYIFPDLSTMDWSIRGENVNITDEKLQLEDQTNTTVSVDADCVQLLDDAWNNRRCPLEDLPLEESRRRRQCRERLWKDLVERSSYVPATSNLDYTQKVNGSLCQLAWMVTNSYGVCLDVPFSIVQAVHDARCFFDSPDNHTCLQSNTTDAICHVSRAILMLMCRDFSSSYIPPVCHVRIRTTGVYSNTTNGSLEWEWPYKVYGKPKMSYKQGLKSATLKYKDLVVDTLTTESPVGVNSLVPVQTDTSPKMAILTSYVQCIQKCQILLGEKDAC